MSDDTIKAITKVIKFDETMFKPANNELKAKYLNLYAVTTVIFIMLLELLHFVYASGKIKVEGVDLTTVATILTGAFKWVKMSAYGLILFLMHWAITTSVMKGMYEEACYARLPSPVGLVVFPSLLTIMLYGGLFMLFTMGTDKWGIVAAMKSLEGFGGGIYLFFKGVFGNFAVIPVVLLLTSILYGFGAFTGWMASSWVYNQVTEENGCLVDKEK